MSRIRSIKPEFWTDEKVHRLTFFERLVFIGLWNYADDEGRARAVAKAVNGFLFPLDDVPDKQVAAALESLHTLHMITLYDIDGVPHLQITNWCKHQRIQRPAPSWIIPPPTAQEPLEASVTPHGSITDQSVINPPARVRSIGAGSIGACSAHRDDERFARFWAVYPKKVAKQEAQRIMRSMNPSDELLSTIIADVVARSKSEDWTHDSGKYIPGPDRYLRNKRWEDQGVDVSLFSGNNGHDRERFPDLAATPMPDGM